MSNSLFSTTFAREMRLFVSILLSLFLSINGLTAQTQGAKPFTIVLDAGHGGKDPGALGKTGREKNINLAVTLAVGKLIEQNLKDMKVVYTRKTDVFVELNERAAIANRAKADLFVSIHTNALPKGAQGKGAETYTLGMHRAADNLEVAYSYKITLSNNQQFTTLQRIIGELSEVKEVIAMNDLTNAAKARRNWLTMQDVLDSVFDTEGQYYSEKIKPLSIETTMLAVGAKSQQFVLRDVNLHLFLDF